MIINLKLNNIEVALSASESIEQTFQPIYSDNVRRFINGDGIKMTSWAGKYEIITNGTGTLPLPLIGVNYANAMIMECASPLSAHSNSNIIALPAGFTFENVNYTSFRSDISMIGHAIVNGILVRTPIISTVDNLVTLTAKSGANGYQVTYWPRFLVFARNPSESHGLRGGGKRSWELIAETV